MKIKVGDNVRFKENDKRTFRVYNIYSKTKVSLGLFDYPDVEQDYQVDVRDLEVI